MLAEILEAAAAEPEEESPLAKTLEKIFTTLKTQTDVLVQIGGMLDKLGPTVEDGGDPRRPSGGRQRRRGRRDPGMRPC